MTEAYEALVPDPSREVYTNASLFYDHQILARRLSDFETTIAPLSGWNCFGKIVVSYSVGFTCNGLS